MQKEAGSMSTTKDMTDDYQTYMRQTSPEPGQIQRGLEARHKRRNRAKSAITLRIDTDILEQLQHMVPDGGDYQGLVNQALREWLDAQGVQGLVRAELKAMTAQVIASIRNILPSA
jgi:uncharacterized protein (DUF4415 family)